MPTVEDKILENAAEEAFALLHNYEFFDDIAKLSEFRGIHDDQIEAALGTEIETAGRSGIIILVQLPRFIPVAPDAPGPLGDIAVGIEIREDPLINREAAFGTGKSAAQVAARVMGLLHRYHTGLGLGMFYLDGEPAELAYRDGRIGYLLAFRLSGTGICLEDSVAKPVITLDLSGDAVITTATSGATRYYTLDDTPPVLGRPGTEIYVTPLAVTSGDIIRALALKPDHRPSNLARLEIP